MEYYILQFITQDGGGIAFAPKNKYNIFTEAVTKIMEEGYKLRNCHWNPTKVYILGTTKNLLPIDKLEDLHELDGIYYFGGDCC